MELSRPKNGSRLPGPPRLLCLPEENRPLCPIELDQDHSVAPRIARASSHIHSRTGRTYASPPAELGQRCRSYSAEVYVEPEPSGSRVPALNPITRTITSELRSFSKAVSRGVVGVATKYSIASVDALFL